MRATTWIRSHILQALLPPALAWGLLMSFAGELDRLASLVAGPERFFLHNSVEDLLPLALALAAGVTVTMVVHRRWPGFPRVPEKVSAAFLLIRLAVYGPLLFVLLAAIFGFGWYVLSVVPNEDPAHSQYGLSAVFAAVLFPSLLTPAFTVLAVWLAALRRAGRTGC
ncbi:MAG: hypothetical protein AB1896_22425 [Thermodesulfobacteriota bacterium]